MANIAGYRAVVEAAQHFGRFFTGQITAAGRVPPAKVAGDRRRCSGAACRHREWPGAWGAIVRAFDTRPEVKEQVESMDGEFLMLDFEEERLRRRRLRQGDERRVHQGRDGAVSPSRPKTWTSSLPRALIPGRPAPELITEEMVASMKPGSVVVDLAAEQGGNCAVHGGRPDHPQARRHHHRLYGSAEPVSGAVEPAVRDQPAAPAWTTCVRRATVN